jgi:hypothetical protein
MDFTHVRDEESEEAVERRPGGCLRGLFRLTLVFLVPLFAVLALLPMLMSSDPGRLWALKKINTAVAPAEVSIGRWSLGWFTAPVLEKMSYRDAGRGADIQVEQVTFNRGLLRLLPVGTLNLGRVTLKNPVGTLSLVPPVAGVKAEPRAAGAGGGLILPVVDVAAEVSVENGSVSVTGNAPDPFVAQHVNGTVTLASFRTPIALQVQMQVGGGTLAVEGRVQSLRELLKGETFGKPEKLTLKLVNVDLTAFGPLIRHASGEPWIRSGVAEGALTALVSGPEQVKLEGGLIVNGLSVAVGRQAPSPKGDLALLVDASVDQKVVSISKFELSSPWLRATAKGTLQQGAKTGTLTGAISAKAEADLVAVTRDFGPLLGFSKGFKMQKGLLVATAEIAADAQALAVDATVAAAELEMVIDGEPVAVKPAPSLVLKASFPHGGWPEVETFRLKAPFADVYGSGRFDAAVVKGKLDLTLFSRDFKRIFKEAPPMVGSVYLDVATLRAEERVALNVFLKLSDVAAELRPGQRLVVPQGTLKAEGFAPLEKGKPGREIQDATFAFTLENGKLSGAWKRLALAQGDRPPVLRGFSVTSDMELGSVRRLLGGFIPAAAQRRMTEWQGRVIANATAEAVGGAVKARLKAAGQQVVAGVDGGVWHVPDVRLDSTLTQGSPKEGIRLEAALTGGGALQRDGATVFSEKAARVVVDARFAPDNSGVRFDTFELSSSLGEVQAQADVSELASRCVVNAKGRLSVDFAAVTQVLEAKGVDEFKMTGRGLREFHFVSPVAGGVTTVFSEGAFDGKAYLGSFKGLGLDAGSSDVSVKLSKGVMRLSYEPALNGGKLRLIPELSVERGLATLSVPPQTRLLENVRLNQEMVDTLLVNVNPLFQGSVVQDGTVTLDLAKCRLASGLSPDKGVAADMNVQFKNLKLEMGPSLRELLAMLKVKERVYSAEQLSIQVTVKDGRLHVAPVRMVIDKQPVVFSGWVAFDGTIQYLIDVPLTDRVTGGAGGNLLKGMTIKIPVTGTVNEPRLDTRVLQNTIGVLLKNAVGEQTVERIGSFLEKLQDELKK